MENKINITLTDLNVEEINAMLFGLQELPAKICNPLSAKIKAQAEKQLADYEAAKQAAND